MLPMNRVEIDATFCISVFEYVISEKTSIRRKENVVTFRYSFQFLCAESPIKFIEYMTTNYFKIKFEVCM